MAESETRKEFMRELAKAHEWRFTLDVGEAIDARHTTAEEPAAVQPRAAATTAGVWREARVVKAEGDGIVVR